MFAGMIRKATVRVKPSDLEKKTMEHAEAVCATFNIDFDSVYYDEQAQCAKVQLEPHVLSNQDILDSLAQFQGCVIRYADDPTKPGRGRGMLCIRDPAASRFSVWALVGGCAAIVASTSFVCAIYLTGDSAASMLGKYWVVFGKMLPADLFGQLP